MKGIAMSRAVTGATESRAAIAALFENSPPLLVEVRFPRMGASPDWYLFDDEAEFDQLVDRLASGVEVRVSSVWDLRNPKGEILLQK
jgi:hypothetical protein